VTQQLVEAGIGVDDDCPHGLKYTPTASPQISLIRMLRNTVGINIFCMVKISVPDPYLLGSSFFFLKDPDHDPPLM